jgi:anthranilate phosphoribosyltransferase
MCIVNKVQLPTIFHSSGKLITPLDTNVVTKSVSRRQREKIQRVCQTLGRATWTMDDFYMNLKLCRSA